MAPQTVEVKAGAIIWATGWTPFDTSAISYYGAGKHRNVISNVVMERLASANGPTGGIISRPSDGRPVKKIAFVQCAGSRDENYLPYCSGVCCLASLKQATYLLEQDQEASVSIFYIDIRALGRYEAFFNKVREDERVALVKGKAGEITENPETGMVTVQVEDQATGKYSGMNLISSFWLPAWSRARPGRKSRPRRPMTNMASFWQREYAGHNRRRVRKKPRRRGIERSGRDRRRSSGYPGLQEVEDGKENRRIYLFGLRDRREHGPGRSVRDSLGIQGRSLPPGPFFVRT